MSTTLAVMLSLSAWHGDKETTDERTTRLAPYAHAIDQVARNDHERAWLIAVGHHESKFARYVTEGRCHEGPPGQRCDNGRAHGPWQLHNWCRARDPLGEAQCAATTMRFAVARCATYEKAFGQYASGKACAAMPERETTRIMVLRRLQGV